MYIVYRSNVSLNGRWFEYENVIQYWPSGHWLGRNECEWIVPGTISCED